MYIEGISKNRYLTGRIGASAASINQAATELARARPNIHPSSSSPIRCDSIGSKLSTGRSCPQSRYLPLPLPPSIVAKRRRRRCVVDDSFLAAFLPRPTDPDSNLDRSRSVSGKMWLDVGRPHRTAVSSGGNWNGEGEEEGGGVVKSIVYTNKVAGEEIKDHGRVAMEGKWDKIEGTIRPRLLQRSC